MRNYFIMLFVAIFFLAGCNDKQQLSVNGTIAKNYLSNEGFEVLTYERDGWHEFSKSSLLELPNEQFWAVQSIEPDEYLDKRIDTVTFTVKHHPLDERYNMGKTTVTVWLFEGEVIGGWSYPISKDDGVEGAPHSLFGETAEDIQGDYGKWFEGWKDKYGD